MAGAAVSDSTLYSVYSLVIHEWILFHSLTVPPYAVATVGIWLAAWWSAKTRMRAPYIIGAAVVAIVGRRSCFLFFS